MKSFLTGSRKYGIPREDSDYDIVVFFPHKQIREIIPQSSQKMGNLNLLFCENLPQYKSWRIGTARCLKQKRKMGRPLSREEAIEIFKQTRDEYNVSYQY